MTDRPRFRPAIALPLPAILEDEAAVRDAAQRDVLALYDEHAARLVRYARSFGLDGTAGDDVVQEVYVALFRHLCLGRPRHSLKGWLFRVTRNLSLKHRRNSRARQCDSISDLLVERLRDPTATPEERVASEQRSERLRLAMATLGVRDQQCLYLRAEGLTYREIANALGISLGSVSKALTRAFAQLARADRG